MQGGFCKLIRCGAPRLRVPSATTGSQICPSQVYCPCRRHEITAAGRQHVTSSKAVFVITMASERNIRRSTISQRDIAGLGRPQGVPMPVALITNLSTQGRNAGAQNIPSPTDDVISDFFSDLGLDDTERAPGPMDDQEAEVVLDKLNLTGTVVRKCYLMAQHYSSMLLANGCSNFGVKLPIRLAEGPALVVALPSNMLRIFLSVAVVVLVMGGTACNLLIPK